MSDAAGTGTNHTPQICKIVIGGGPCSGKTTALDWLRKGLEARGYKLVFVPEAATELINGGVAPWTCRSYDDFQRAVFEMQLGKEAAFVHAVEAMADERVVIIFDRGVLDHQGYMTPEGFARLLADHHTTKEELFARYDVVFHLVSAAKGLTTAYTLDNNAARAETPEQAAAVDDRLIAAWEDHPDFRLIGSTEIFADKMGTLMRQVLQVLGEPEVPEGELVWPTE